MQKVPKVSVLIPTYNCAHFLKDAIESVLIQTFTDYELIIVDNNSIDNTFEVVESYKAYKQITYVKNDHDLPMAGNWNKCLLLAKGEYLKFLCADDTLHPTNLERLVNILDTHLDVSIASSYFQNFGSNNKVIKHPFVRKSLGKEVLKSNILYYNSIGTPSQVLFRRKDLWIGLFRTEFVWMIDADFWHRLLYVGNYYCIPEVLSFVRCHEEQATTYTYRNFSYIFDDYTYRKNLQYVNDFNVNEYRTELKFAVQRRILNIIDKVPRMVREKRFDLVLKAFTYAYDERMVFRSLLKLLNVAIAGALRRIDKFK